MAATMKTHAHNGTGTARLKPRPRPQNLERDLANRLKRAEGQLRGLGKMVAEDTYCIEVLQQISAVRRALDKIALLLSARSYGDLRRRCARGARIPRENRRID